MTVCLSRSAAFHCLWLCLSELCCTWLCLCNNAAFYYMWLCVLSRCYVVLLIAVLLLCYAAFCCTERHSTLHDLCSLQQQQQQHDAATGTTSVGGLSSNSRSVSEAGGTSPPELSTPLSPSHQQMSGGEVRAEVETAHKYSLLTPSTNSCPLYPYPLCPYPVSSYVRLANTGGSMVQ